MILEKLNTKAVGAAGLVIGGGSITASVAALFNLLSNPTYLDALFVAAMHSRAHATTPDDIHTYAQLVGAGIAIIGSAILSLLMANVGKSVFAKTNSGTVGAGNAADSATAGPTAEGK